MSKVKKTIIIVLAILLVAFLAAITTICIMLSMVFDRDPFAKSTALPDQEAMSSAISKFSSSMSEGYSFGADLGFPGLDIFSGEDDSAPDAPPDAGQDASSGDAMALPAEIKLDNAEANAILAGFITAQEANDALDGAPGANSPLKELTRLEIRDGRLVIEYPLDIRKLGFSSPFGPFVNLHCELVPEIKDRTLSVRLDKLRAGKLSLPLGSIQKYLDQAILELANDKQYQELMDLILGLKIAPEGVTVRYSRTKLTSILVKFADFSSMLQGAQE